MLPLVWKSEKPGLLPGSGRRAVSWASAGAGVADLGPALLVSRCSRAQAGGRGGEASGGRIGGDGQGVALLPVVPLEVVLQRSRLGPRIITVGTFVRAFP